MTTALQHTILVTGAASGIGLAFTKHYLTKPNLVVIAVDINEIPISDPPSCSTSLLYKQKADFSSEGSIKDLTRNVTNTLRDLHESGSSPKLDLIIHSAGIRGLVPSVEKANPENVAVAETLQAMDSETLMTAYQINTVGTFLLLQSLALADLYHQNPFLYTLSSQGASQVTTKVVIMGSRMGSLTHARTTNAGGAYAYRASKAALNAIVTSMSIDLPHIVFVLIHPGRVETGLTLCREDGAIEVEHSVKDMLELIKRLGIKDSGKFMDRFGTEIAW